MLIVAQAFCVFIFGKMQPMTIREEQSTFLDATRRSISEEDSFDVFQDDVFGNFFNHSSHELSTGCYTSQ